MKKTIVIVKHLLAVLKFPRSVPVFLVYAKAISKAMKEAALFSGSAAKLATLDTSVDLLDDTQSGTKMKPPTHTIADRDVLLEDVKTNLRSLLSDVQAAADANRPSALAIIESAAMSAKKEGTRKKRENKVTDGAVSGSIDLEAEESGPHEWRWSTDGVTWNYLPATYTAKTSASGFTPLLLYYFDNRPILRNGVISDWSVVISIRMK